MKKTDLSQPHIVKYDDRYLSGAPIDQIVFGGGKPDVVPQVKWTLPNGDRLTTTLIDYNRSFPFIFNHEARWRNAMNLRNRKRLGLTDYETKELAAFDVQQSI